MSEHEAAERARQRMTSEGLSSDDDYHNPTSDFEDNAILAAAYLREHDETEPRLIPCFCYRFEGDAHDPMCPNNPHLAANRAATPLTLVERVQRLAGRK
jgi:hypothetical protein